MKGSKWCLVYEDWIREGKGCIPAALTVFFLMISLSTRCSLNIFTELNLTDDQLMLSDICWLQLYLTSFTPLHAQPPF